MSVQSGQITLADTAQSVTVDQGVDTGFDTAVTPANTILVFSQRGTGSGTPESFVVAGQLTNGTTITFQREGTSGAITIEWLLYEDSRLTVQHLNSAVMTTTTDSVAITAVDLSKAFIIHSGGIFDNTNNYHTGFCQIKFDSTTQVGLTRGLASGTDIQHFFQVVEYEDCSVTSYDITFTTTTNLTDSHTITAVSDQAKTLLFATMRTPTSALGPDDGQHSMSFASDTQVDFTRVTGTSATFDITLFVVEFTDASSVQRGNLAIAADPTNETITSVDTARAVVFLSSNSYHCNAGGTSDIASAQAQDRVQVTSKLTTSTNLQIQEGDTVGAVTVDYQVIEFAAAAAGGSVSKKIVAVVG